ncbi:hypothetical protein ABFS82_10G117900 [Erythranthe guttata]
MGDKYLECHKSHANLGGKIDGCQEFIWSDQNSMLDCDICGCHRNFHWKVEAPVVLVTEVVYTKCNNTRDFEFQTTVDGCQDFLSNGRDLGCNACSCNMSFHQKEIIVKQ